MQAILDLLSSILRALREGREIFGGSETTSPTPPIRVGDRVSMMEDGHAVLRALVLDAVGDQLLVQWIPSNGTDPSGHAQWMPARQFATITTNGD